MGTPVPISNIQGAPGTTQGPGLPLGGPGLVGGVPIAVGGVPPVGPVVEACCCIPDWLTGGFASIWGTVPLFPQDIPWCFHL
jgi:hypothetical protein